MISVNNITKEFGGEALFSSISFNISLKERIGLAGQNGAGKTTLLKIISGQLPSETGEVVWAGDIKMGYLQQEMQRVSEKTVIDETLYVYDFLLEKQNRITEISHLLGTRTDYESNKYANLVDELDKLNHEISVYETDKLRGKAEQILKGLGFVQTDFERNLEEFSFGWQMRVELAKLLLQNPPLLLLDEPTNHLDIESIQWLEDYLKTYSGSIVLVSHDRTLLDNLTTRTIEINKGKAYDYKVGYSEYIRLREERQIQLEASYTNQQKEIKEVERFVERFRYKASKSKQVQSRVKQLEKVDRIKLDSRDTASIHFSFPEAKASGKVVFEAKELSKSYGDNLVLKNINQQIIRGEKVAFVGKNGEGKSTMAKIIMNSIDFEGELKKGHNVSLGYYSQDIWEMLDSSQTVFETIDNVAVGEIRTKIKSILGAFLFQGDDIDKKVKVLSGGEKSRLALVKLLLSPSNLLLLDEPTNHLDILSKDILKSALLQYHGTVIIVSHDRDFLMGLTDRILEFRNKGIKEYLGDIQYFLEKKKFEKVIEKNYDPSTEVEKKSSANKLSWEKKKEQEKISRRLKKELNLCESNIEKIENQIEEVNLKMSKPDMYAEEFKSGELFKKHDALTSELKNVYDRWEELSLQIEDI
jgi:ATP-binding cassette subfamily F protein 3